MAERSVATLSNRASDGGVRLGPADPVGAWDRVPFSRNKATAQESGLRENCTSRLSERAEAGRKLHLPRLYTEEAG